MVLFGQLRTHQNLQSRYRATTGLVPKPCHITALVVFCFRVLSGASMRSSISPCAMMVLLLCVLALSRSVHARNLNQVPNQPVSMPGMNQPINGDAPGTTAAAGPTEEAAAGKKEAPAATAGGTYPTLEAALKGSSSTTADLSIVQDALQKSGIMSSIKANSAYTLLVRRMISLYLLLIVLGTLEICSVSDVQCPT